jgi:hypothetical protein
VETGFGGIAGLGSRCSGVETRSSENERKLDFQSVERPLLAGFQGRARRYETNSVLVKVHRLQPLVAYMALSKHTRVVAKSFEQ